MYALCTFKETNSLSIIFRIVADNIDYTIHARVQSEKHTNKSIHWIQKYAVVNKVVEPYLSSSTPRKLLKNVQLADLLPNKAVHERLVQRWAVLISRVICKYFDKFQHLQSVVVYHIPHKYSKEMGAKSEMVRIFILGFMLITPCMLIQYNPVLSGALVYRKQNLFFLIMWLISVVL